MPLNLMKNNGNVFTKGELEFLYKIIKEYEKNSPENNEEYYDDYYDEYKTPIKKKIIKSILRKVNVDQIGRAHV